MPKPIDVEKIGLDNDFLFSAVMSDEKICKTFLERLLKIEIEKIVCLDAQKTFNNGFDIKGIRLDIYAKDGMGTVYNIEMQVSKERNIPKRMRYYQSDMDGDALMKGMMFDDLPNSFIIFICTWDFVGFGESIYVFKDTLEGRPEYQLNNGTTRIILNTEGSREGLNKDLVDFLDYIKSGTVSGEWVKDIDKKVRMLKCDKTWRANYMNWIMHENELRREGHKEGHKEGLEEGLEKFIEGLNEVGCSVDTIQNMVIKKFYVPAGVAKEYIE
jgi:predicted transposase/invertase (TIGR01784 family)